MTERPEEHTDQQQYTYINGLGFLPQSPQQKELRQLHLSYNVVLFCILLLYFLRVAMLLPVLRLMSIVGFQVSVNPMTQLVIHSEAAYQVANIFVYVIQMMVPAWIIWILFHRGMQSAKLFSAPRQHSVGTGIFLIFGTSIIAQAMAFLFSHVLELGGIVVSHNSVQPPKDSGALVLYLFSMTLLPALLESVLFQGMILGVFRKFGDLLAIFVSSVCMMMVQQNLNDMVYTFVMAIVLGYFAIFSGSIWVPIAGNFTVRSVQTLFYLLQIWDDSKQMELIGYGVEILLLAISLLMFGYFLFRNHKAFYLKRGDTYLTNRTKVKYLITNFAFWMVAILALLNVASNIQLIN